jgi:uncharacterized membrane protein
MHVSRFFFDGGAQYPTNNAALQHQTWTGRMLLITVVAWLYVALMMALAEANHANGSLLGAIVTFVLYGVGPVALVAYLMGRPARRAARQSREAAQVDAATAQAPASAEPDGRGQAAADAVAPVRKEP